MDSYRNVCLVSSDWHLANRKWKDRYELNSDSYYSLAQLANLARYYKIPMLCSGDLFDKKLLTPDILDGACEALSVPPTQINSSLEHLDIYYIQGNHDYQGNIPWLDVVGMSNNFTCKWIGNKNINNTRRLGTAESVDNVEIPVYAIGVDFCSDSYLENRINEAVENAKVYVRETHGDVPVSFILVLHQPVQNFMGENLGNINLNNIVPDDIDLVIIGDYHVTLQETIKTKGDKIIEVWSPGSICLQSITEDPNKFALLMSCKVDKNLTGGNIYSVSYKLTPIALHTRPFHSFNVNCDNDLDDAVNQIVIFAEDERTETNVVDSLGWDNLKKLYWEEKGIHTPICKVRYNTKVDNVRDTVMAAVKNKAHIFFYAASEEEEETERVVTSLAELCKKPQESLLLCLPDVVDKKAKPELFEFMTDLLTSEHVDVTINDKRKEICGI